MRTLPILLAVLALFAGPSRALDFTLPDSARLTSEVLRDPDSYMLPVAPFKDGALPVVEVEGRVLQRSWRIERSDMTTLQMIRPLREEMSAAGYDIILDCGGQECGGFDFRFNTAVMTAPAMYVDLFDFRFVSARRDDPGDSTEANYVAVIASVTGGAGYVQIIHVSPNGDTDAGAGAPKAVPVASPDEPETVVQALVGQGHVILSDLDFATGSSDLGAGPHDSLMRLAEFLTDDKTRRIALVGHTDLVGSMEDNVRLSKERAMSVLDRLVQSYGVPSAQLTAEGVGYLSPIAPNRTARGREANRRVEAVLLSSE